MLDGQDFVPLIQWIKSKQKETNNYPIAYEDRNCLVNLHQIKLTVVKGAWIKLIVMRRALK